MEECRGDSSSRDAAREGMGEVGGPKEPFAPGGPSRREGGDQTVCGSATESGSTPAVPDDARFLSGAGLVAALTVLVPVGIGAFGKAPVRWAGITVVFLGVASVAALLLSYWRHLSTKQSFAVAVPLMCISLLVAIVPNQITEDPQQPNTGGGNTAHAAPPPSSSVEPEPITLPSLSSPSPAALQDCPLDQHQDFRLGPDYKRYEGPLSDGGRMDVCFRFVRSVDYNDWQSVQYRVRGKASSYILRLVLAESDVERFSTAFRITPSNEWKAVSVKGHKTSRPNKEQFVAEVLSDAGQSTYSLGQVKLPT